MLARTPVTRSIANRHADILGAESTNDVAFDLAGWDELRSLDPLMITVGSHSMTHPILPSMSSEEIEAELRDSKEAKQASVLPTQ